MAKIQISLVFKENSPLCVLWRGKKRGGGEGSEGLPLSGGYALLSLSKPF